MSAAKQKGTAFETAVTRYLLAQGLHAHRVTLAGARDCGDVRVDDWILELKNRRAYDFASAVDEAIAEAANAGALRYAAVIKRNGRGDPARAYVVMELEQFAALLSERVAK